MKYLTFFLLLGVGLARKAEAASQGAPNFLFILVDDQGWSGTPVAMIPGKDFSRTPVIHMPNVERLASQGMVFSQAYAGHPKCECSRASLLMGMTTTSLNATDKQSHNWNAPSGDSLANTLKRANPSYRAAHLGKWQWPQTPESMGYDVSDGITMNEDGDSPDPKDPKRSFSMTRRAQAYMEAQVKDGHPFYLQLSYYAVHNQPQALAATSAKYQKMGPRQDGRGNPAMMAAMSEDLDTCIGDLLKTVDQLGIRKNTYVIYISDNGGRTRILKGGKGTVDEGGLRVPLIVTGPGVGGAAYCNEPVVGYDILPTVVDLAAPGFALPKGVEGGSWKAVLLNGGDGKVRRPIDRMVFHHAVEVEHPQTAMRKGDLKLIYYWDTKESFLYDLKSDLGEEHNIAESKSELTKVLLTELQAHVRTGLDKQRYAALESGKIISDGKGKGPRPDGKRQIPGSVKSKPGQP